MGILRDITDRKKAEEKIESLAKFPAENPAPVLRISKDCRILYANNASSVVMETWGRQEGERLPEACCKLAQQALRSGKVSTFEFACHDGRTFEVKLAPVAESGYVNAYGLDITERKRAEQALRDYQARLKSLAAELALAEERERRRIAAGIHDDLGQKLALAKMELQLLARSPGKSKIPASLDSACARIDEAIKDAHSLTFELSNPALYDLSFEAAIELWLLEQIQKKHGIKCTVIADEQAVPLDENGKVVLFRALRELAVNVVKHAKATALTVTIEKLENSVQITCKDDGLGFAPPEAGALPRDVGGFGLFNIKERLEYLGGGMKLQSAPGRGTLITLSLPTAAGLPLKRKNAADADEGRQ